MKILLSILGAIGLGVTPATISTNLLSQEENAKNNNLKFAVDDKLYSYTGVPAFGAQQDVSIPSAHEFVISWDKLGMSYSDLVKNYSTLKLDYKHCYVNLKSGWDASYTYNIKLSELNLTSVFKFSSEWTETYLLNHSYNATTFGHVLCRDILYTQAGLDGLHFKTET